MDINKDELMAEAQRRGLIQPPSKTDLLAEAQRRGLIKEPEPMNKDNAMSKGWNYIKNAVKGNAEHKDHISWNQYGDSLPWAGGINGMKVAAAGMFGTDQDKLNSINKHYDNIRQIMQKDKNGNPFFIAPDGKYKGKVVYVDDPRLDLGDAADFVGQGLSYAEGGALTDPIKNALGRTLATTGVMGATNAVNQELAGRDDVDGLEVAITGLFGGAFEGAMPIISKISRYFKNRGATNTQIGKVVAKELKMGNLSKKQLNALGKYTSQLDDSITKESIAQHIELNQIPTRGTLTKNQAILTSEKDLRASGNDATTNFLRNLDDTNRAGRITALNNFKKNLSGGNPQSVDAMDAAAGIGKAVQYQENIAKKGVKSAYDAVGDASVGKNEFINLKDKILKRFSENDVIVDPSNIEKTNVALNDLSNSISKINKKGISGVTFKSLEAQRRRIISQYNGKIDKTDRRALTILLNEYDDAVEKAFAKDLITGDPSALSNLKKARRTYSEYTAKFNKQGARDKGGKMIDDWLDSNTSPEDIANGIINANGVITKNAPYMAQRYLNIVGEKSKEANLLREMVTDRLFKNLNGDKSKDALYTSLTKSLKGSPTFMNKLFTPKEMAFLSRTLQFVGDTKVKGIAGRSSGTTERLFRMLNNKSSTDNMGAGVINTIKAIARLALRQGKAKTLNLPYKQINNDEIRATGGLLGDAYSNQ